MVTVRKKGPQLRKKAFLQLIDNVVLVLAQGQVLRAFHFMRAKSEISMRSCLHVSLITKPITDNPKIFLIVKFFANRC